MSTIKVLAAVAALVISISAQAGADEDLIPASQVQKVVETHKSVIRRICVEPSGAKSAHLQVNLTSDANGSPEAVEVKGSLESIDQCVEKSIKAWKFQSEGKASFALHFVN